MYFNESISTLLRLVPDVRHEKPVLGDDPGVVGLLSDPGGIVFVLDVRIADMEHPPTVARVGVSQDRSVSNTVQVRRSYQPAVPVVVVSVVPVVPVVVAAEVVTDLVYGGVVGVGAALLHRGECVAAA